MIRAKLSCAFGVTFVVALLAAITAAQSPAPSPSEWPCTSALEPLYDCFVDQAMMQGFDSFRPFLIDTVLNLAGNCSLPFFDVIECAKVFEQRVDVNTTLSTLVQCVQPRFQRLKSCVDRFVPALAACTPLVPNALQCVIENAPTCSPRPIDLVGIAVCDEEACVVALSAADACVQTKLKLQQCWQTPQTNTAGCIRSGISEVIQCALDTLPKCKAFDQSIQDVFEELAETEDDM
mmetsp:Transcript_1527/g.3212  ORF Transcript_1527/g.3212 Transcript_1527/m.3212 type:complete len:235 (-) Transcript_1527:333-1037(-)